jgi:hypothetical protein
MCAENKTPMIDRVLMSITDGENHWTTHLYKKDIISRLLNSQFKLTKETFDKINRAKRELKLKRILNEKN